MPTRNVFLTPHQSHFVEQLVNTGRYQNTNDILLEGLRFDARRVSQDELRLTVLRDAAGIGMTNIDIGALQSSATEQVLGEHLATCVMASPSSALKRAKKLAQVSVRCMWPEKGEKALTSSCFASTLLTGTK
jgi:antitoxin ParD1/3/4